MERYKTNRDGEVEVLWQKGNNCRVRFINTGYERDVQVHNLRNGKCMDHTVEDRTRGQVEVNQVVPSNGCGDVLIIWKNGKQCLAQFINTGYTRTALIDNVMAGKIRDPYALSRWGVGYYGEYKKTPYHKQAQQLWSNMLKRCYYEKDLKGYFGKGVSVDARWHCYANFIEDLPSLRNFDLWLKGQYEGAEKYNLDKDFKYEGNKVYSRETCEFITESLNKGYTSRTLTKRT